MLKPTIPTSDTAPFELPLSPGQFQRAMSIGHGRAWRHVLQHGATGLHDILQHALLHSLAFDAQCEGDRGSWVMDIVDGAGAGASLYPEFIRQVHDAPVDDYDCWHISQRGTVLAALAKRGIAEAKAALDRLFADNRTKHPNELLGALDIIDVDGEIGLLQVCSVLGNEARERSSGTVDDWFLNVFDGSRQDGAGIKFLESARERDSGIDRFLSIREGEQARRKTVNQNIASQRGAPPSKPFGDDYASVPQAYHHLTAEQIIDWVQNAPTQASSRASTSEGRGWLRGWGIKAGDTAIDRVLRALEETESGLEQRRYLSIFAKRPMPRVSDKVIQLAESQDEHVRARAYAALKNIADPRIRAVALRSLTPERIKTGSLELWQSSYEPHDHQAIEGSLYVPDDVGELHSLIFDLAYVCANVKRAECLSLMLFVYEYSPCGNCRGRVVEVMVELGIAPQWMIEECCFDAMEDIREKFGGPKLAD